MGKEFEEQAFGGGGVPRQHKRGSAVPTSIITHPTAPLKIQKTPEPAPGSAILAEERKMPGSAQGYLSQLLLWEPVRYIACQTARQLARLHAGCWAPRTCTHSACDCASQLRVAFSSLAPTAPASEAAVTIGPESASKAPKAPAAPVVACSS